MGRLQPASEQSSFILLDQEVDGHRPTAGMDSLCYSCEHPGSQAIHKSGDPCQVYKKNQSENNSRATATTTTTTSSRCVLLGIHILPSPAPPVIVLATERRDNFILFIYVTSISAALLMKGSQRDNNAINMKPIITR